MLGVFPSTFRRAAAVVDARRCYIVACVCLVIVAAVLRFYNLSGHTLRPPDEALAASFSMGELSEVLEKTRGDNTSPILYPLALWAVQKWASTEFSVRVMSAMASTLTVGVLLFAMPRLGVARWAAFVAGLLATFSVAGIEHGRGGREYSVDALVAALMIVGLLQYLRDGRKGLLCGALLVGPFVQYGLVLFGAAALCVAAVANTPSRTYVCNGRLSYRRRVWEWLRVRVDLLLPLGVFVAACALSWAVTARYQWEDGAHLAYDYYKSGFDAAALVEFAISRTWGMLSYHMPSVVAGAALLAFVALLCRSLWRRRLDAVVALAVVVALAAICGALLEAYPFGGTRHSIYLSPAVFLAAGVALHSVVNVAVAAVVGCARRLWVGRALAVAAVVALAVACGAAVHHHRDNIYRSDQSMKQAIAALEAHGREGDAVYVSKFEAIVLEFYKPIKPANYFYGSVYRRVLFPIPGRNYAAEMLDEMFRAFDSPRRIWLLHNRGTDVPEVVAAHSAAHSQEALVEEVVVNDGWVTLHLITGFEGLAASIRDEWLNAASGVPDVVSDYSLYVKDGMLYYAKADCGPADTDAPFFLNIYPEYAADLSDGRRQYGYDIIKFGFHNTGWRIDDKCLVRRALPDYPIKWIHTGQYVSDGPVVWEADFPFNPKVWFDMYDEVVSVEPSAVGVYDLYLRDDALYYVKRPCASSDIEARFFLHIYPWDAADLPEALRGYGLHNLDFEFRDYGWLDGDRCFIRRALPGYPIERIHTGQFVLDGSVVWEAELSFER